MSNESKTSFYYANITEFMETCAAMIYIPKTMADQVHWKWFLCVFLAIAVMTILYIRSLHLKIEELTEQNLDQEEDFLRQVNQVKNLYKHEICALNAKIQRKKDLIRDLKAHFGAR